MWTSKYENGCLIMLKYALEPLYAPEPLCDCLHQVVTHILAPMVVCLFAWPSNECEAGSDICFDRNPPAFLMLIMLFSC